MLRYLAQFFYGIMDPPARESIHPEAMRKVQRTLSDLEKWLLEQLEEPQRDRFLAYTDAWSELNARCDLDSFVCGFRMGARLILDTFMTEEE